MYALSLTHNSILLKLFVLKVIFKMYLYYVHVGPII